MKRRGYNPNFTGIERKDFPLVTDHYWNDWTPTNETIEINRQRINERELDSLIKKQENKNRLYKKTAVISMQHQIVEHKFVLPKAFQNILY